MDGWELIRVGLFVSDAVSCSKRDLKRKSTFKRDDKDTKGRYVLDSGKHYFAVGKSHLDKI